MNMEKKDDESSCSSASSDCCPICISPIVQESYLDCCLHKFCYNCILQWTKVVARKRSSPPSSVDCPLCKRASSSIVYGYDGTFFRQHHLINQNMDYGAFFTKAHNYRLMSYYVEGQAATIGNIINVSRYWKSYRYRQPNQWLYSWLRREIQALKQKEDVEIMVHLVVGVIDSWRRNEPKNSKIPPETKQEEFRNLVAEAARRFLTGRTERFVNELEIFLASGWNIEAYDKVYIRHLGWKIPEISKEDQDEPECTPTVPYLSFSDEEFDDTDLWSV